MIWSDVTFHQFGPAVFTPYLPNQVRALEDGTPIKSRGQSSAGYDITTSNRWRVPNELLPAEHVIDLRFPASVERAFVRVDTTALVLPPHGVCFVESLEHITMPADVLALAVGKSTDARRGINVYVTPLEPAWRGHLVIEIVNTAPFHQVLRAGEGIAQLVFMVTDWTPETTYDERPSAYQDQSGVASARLV